MKRRVRAFLLVTRHWLRFVIDCYVCRACCKNGHALTNNDIMSFTLCLTFFEHANRDCET